MFRIQRIDHAALSVRDPDASMDWYRLHLGFERRFEDLWEGPPYMIGAGEACLALFPAGQGPEEPAALRMLHLAFLVGWEDFEEARRQLGQAGLAAREVEHENCRSLYLQDPDGHPLELTTYESP